MEELTLYELISINTLLQQEIVRIKCYLNTFGDDAVGYQEGDLECCESAYAKVQKMLRRARCAKVGGNSGKLA